MGAKGGKTKSANRCAKNKANKKKRWTSEEVLDALTEFGVQHYNFKPGVSTELGAAVYNQLRARSGSPQDWERRKRIKELHDTMSVAWKKAIDGLVQMNTNSCKSFYPLKITKANGAKSAEQVKVVGSPGLAIETCKKPANEGIDARFFVNARNRGASWASSGGVFDKDLKQIVRNSVLNLNQCDATTAQTIGGVSVQLASQDVVDFLYLALCDTARCLDKTVGVGNWCVTWGTLLAACRSPSGGMIPWDNDADILAVPQDYAYFMQNVLPTLEFQLRALGYGVHIGHEGWIKVYPGQIAKLTEAEKKQECRHRIRELNKREGLKLNWGASAKMATQLWGRIVAKKMDLVFVGNNTVDIFVAKRSGSVIRTDWANIDESFIFPMQLMSFGPVVVPGPAKRNILLISWYGAEWKKHMYRHPISHRMVELELEATFPKELLPSKDVLKLLNGIGKKSEKVRLLRRPCASGHKPNLCRTKKSEKVRLSSEAKAKQCGSKGKKAKP